MTKEAQDIILKIWPCILQLFGLTFAVSLDSYIDARKRRRLLTIVVLVFTILVLDFAQPDDAPDIVRIVASITGYTIRPAVLAVFILIVDDFKAPWIYWIPIAINNLLNIYLEELVKSLFQKRKGFARIICAHKE